MTYFVITYIICKSEKKGVSHLTFFYIYFYKDFRSFGLFKECYLFLERGEWRERERERNINVREKYWSAASHRDPDQGPGHAAWPGIKLATFCFAGRCPAIWATSVRASHLTFLSIIVVQTPHARIITGSPYVDFLPPILPQTQLMFILFKAFWLFTVHYVISSTV